jgi:hypothetical protein
VLLTDQMQESFVEIVDLPMVPPLDGRALELGDGMDVDHDCLA